ncbi:MAG: 6-phosphogluconolactonase [Candidatus Protochlamydia sp.]|nr:6-phosphogluconolactonase [Candidatus Protochlamydia sp.]
MNKGEDLKNKACLFNLIIYTQETCRADYFKEMGRMIMEQFPCRIIFIQGDRSSKESYLRQKILTEPLKDSYAPILIEAAGDDLIKAPFLVLPLFVPDLPIYLLWGEDPTTENKILPHLQKFATRLIFDSECTEDLTLFSQHMQEMLAASTEIVDMNWARIGGWRELIAQIFDSKERLKQLETASNIKIIYNNVHSPFFTHPDTQAIYLQGWLASRLGWEFLNSKKEKDHLKLYYQKDQKPVQIDLIGKSRPDLLPEEIIEIEGSNQETFVCQIIRKEKNQVIVHTSNQYQCELPFSLFLPTLRTGRSFMQEIFFQKVSGHYREMLSLISKIKWSENNKLENLKLQNEPQHIDERRDVIIPGDKDTTIKFCVQQFLEIGREAIAKRGRYIVALSGGQTPNEIFKELSKPQHRNELDWTKVLCFWSDERSVPPNDPESNYGMAMESGLMKLPLLSEHIFRMKGESSIEENALQYEELIRQWVPSVSFDLIMLGIGEDGHTASLFPRTHGLHAKDRLVVANYVPQKQTWRMTLTYECIHAGKTICIYALGSKKAEIVLKTLTGAYDPDNFPVQRIGTAHHQAHWILDQEAAGKILKGPSC